MELNIIELKDGKQFSFRGVTYSVKEENHTYVVGRSKKKDFLFCEIDGITEYFIIEEDHGDVFVVKDLNNNIYLYIKRFNEFHLASEISKKITYSRNVRFCGIKFQKTRVDWNKGLVVGKLNGRCFYFYNNDDRTLKQIVVTQF